MKNKEMKYYQAGMERAYRIVKEEGVEALEKEIRFRNITGINARLTAKEIDTGIDDIKAYTIHTVLTITIGVLYSVFDMGKVRLERFRQAFMEAIEPLNEGIVTWSDICHNIEDLTGVHVNLTDMLENDTGMLKEGKDKSA